MSSVDGSQGSAGDPSGSAAPLTIGLVAHYVFCPRRAWLEVAGEKTDTNQMAAGKEAHRVTDDAARRTPGVLRAIDVQNLAWGYYGRCDTIRRRPDGQLEVVEYKATPVRRRAEVTPAMKIQLVLQVLALESMGERVGGQSIYFSDHQQHVPVQLTDRDRIDARILLEETRRVVESANAPPPLVDDPKCFSCSHASVCLPEERRLEPITRRIRVADPDSQVVHLTVPGSRASIRTGRLVVQKTGETLASVPVERIQGVIVHGNIDLSSGLIRELLWRSLSIVWCSGGGRVIGWASAAGGPNGATRVRQHVASAASRLDLAREFISAKVGNQATILRRNGSASGEVIGDLRRLAAAARAATDNEALFGVEGEAAALYFASFGRAT